MAAIFADTDVFCGQIRLIYAGILSPSELGKILCGENRILKEFFAILYKTLLVMMCSSAVLASSIALNALSSHTVCTLRFKCIVAAAAVLIRGALRQLTKVAWLGWIGVVSV